MGENQNDGFVDDPKVDVAELAGLKLFEGIDPKAMTPEQAEQVMTTAKTLLVQKKKWREIAINPTTGKPWKDAPADVKLPTSTAQQPTALEQDVAGLKLSEEKRQFGHANGLDPEETDNAFAFAKGAGITPAQVLANAFFKNGLEANRQGKKNSSATPGSSRRAVVVEGKTFAQMTPKEREANFGKIAEGTRRK